jgi:hypothetical protein
MRFIANMTTIILSLMIPKAAMVMVEADKQ